MRSDFSKFDINGKWVLNKKECYRKTTEKQSRAFDMRIKVR